MKIEFLDVKIEKYYHYSKKMVYNAEEICFENKNLLTNQLFQTKENSKSPKSIKI